jgi:hypothetical protein
MYFVLRLLACMSLISFLTYSYLKKLNTLTEFRLQLPLLEQKLHETLSLKQNLQFEIERDEGAKRLEIKYKETAYAHLIPMDPKKTLTLKNNEHTKK